MWNYLKSFGLVQCQVPTYEDSLQVSHFAPLCVWCVCVAGRKTWRLEMFPQQSLGAPASMGNKGCHPMAQNHLRETSSSLRCSLGTSTSWSFWFTKRLSSLADYIFFFFPIHPAAPAPRELSHSMNCSWPGWRWHCRCHCLLLMGCFPPTELEWTRENYLISDAMAVFPSLETEQLC